MAVPTAHWRDHWDKHAGQWQRIGSPLRPCPEDVALLSQAVAGAGPEGLLLGVTPELAAIGTITALDHNPAMIGTLAVGHTVHGEWLDMPFPDARFDFALGDGSPNMLAYPHGYTALFQQLARVLKPGARVAFRLFAAPEEGESLATLQAEAMAGRIGSFHAFKWRLAMALVRAAGDANIAVARIHAAFQQHFPDRAALAQATGWAPESIQTIDVYAGSDVVYNFPTLSQMRAVSAPYLRECGVAYGSYELAERCPVLSYERIA